MASKQAKILSLEEILAADDSTTTTLDIPEWGGAIRLRSFTKDVELAMRAAARDERGDVDVERLEMLMLIYGVEEPVLTPDMVPHLRTKSATVIDRILSEIVRINRLGPDAVKEAASTFPEGT